jgi:hypothetical protein
MSKGRTGREKINEVGVDVGREGAEDTHLIECPQTRSCAGRWPFMRRSEVLAIKDYPAWKSPKNIEFLG